MLAGLTRETALLLNRGIAKVERLRRPDELRRIASVFEGLTALEIGGPSQIFDRRGLLPVYSGVMHCDLVNYASETLWDGHARAPIAIRRRFVAEAVDLGVPTDSYGGLLASHVLEHVANPLAALREWQRVVASGGPLLIVLPHRDYTFDHRRDVTRLAHLVEDYRADVAEDDLTHLDELIARHDPRHDEFIGDRAAFIQRCRDNERHRIMHHHVFVTRAVVELIEHAGLKIEAVTARRPHHIIILARTPRGSGIAADGSQELLAGALAKSPFPSDAREARR